VQKCFQLQHLQGNLWLFLPFYLSAPDKTMDSGLLGESSTDVENTTIIAGVSTVVSDPSFQSRVLCKRVCHSFLII